MADELDKLFSKIQMGAELASPSDLAEFSNSFCASKTQALLSEALVDFDDRKVEDEEWEAFHSRTFRQEVPNDLRHSRLSSAEPEVDALLSQHNVSLDQGSPSNSVNATLHFPFGNFKTSAIKTPLQFA
jgi:hypothetical protein